MLSPTALYNDLTDATLLELLAANDEAAFRAIYDRYSASLYSTACQRLPVAHKAEDIIQEVFLNLYRHRDSVEKIKDLRTWLFACLRNKILNEIRDMRLHEKHEKKLASIASTDTAAVSSTYDLCRLEKLFQEALLQLTDRCRQVFLLSRVQHLPNREIAEKLDVSVKAVEKNMTKALKIIKTEIGI
jgi:RNA polymerase sigma-70 factor (family 1)